MSYDKIDYNELINDAMISVVRTVLKYVQHNGLPGEHHFYITFNTNHHKVSIPKFLKDQYPEEVTIVLRYQFKDLLVYQDYFTVTLSFNKIPYNILVPFGAINLFSDPSVNFVLQLVNEFDEEDKEDFMLNEEETNKEMDIVGENNIIDFNHFKKNKASEKKND